MADADVPRPHAARKLETGRPGPAPIIKIWKPDPGPVIKIWRPDPRPWRARAAGYTHQPKSGSCRGM